MQVNARQNLLWLFSHYHTQFTVVILVYVICVGKCEFHRMFVGTGIWIVLFVPTSRSIFCVILVLKRSLAKSYFFLILPLDVGYSYKNQKCRTSLYMPYTRWTHPCRNFKCSKNSNFILSQLHVTLRPTYLIYADIESVIFAQNGTCVLTYTYDLYVSMYPWSLSYRKSLNVGLKACLHKTHVVQV